MKVSDLVAKFPIDTKITYWGNGFSNKVPSDSIVKDWIVTSDFNLIIIIERGDSIVNME